MYRHNGKGKEKQDVMFAKKSKLVYNEFMEAILLASGSLRRQEYFRMLCLPFSIMPPQIDETNNDNLPPRELAEDLAKRKINRIVSQLNGRLPKWIFAADTLISLDGSVVGKSKDRDEAFAAIRRYSGRDHEVITAIALYNNKTKTIDCTSVTSTVTFAEMKESDITWYVDTGEWQGAAGAYKVQGLASCFIKNINGSYSSIVGLPLHEFYEMLMRNDYPFHDHLL